MNATLSQDTLKRVNRWKLIGVLALVLATFVVVLAVENMTVSMLVAFVISYTLGPWVNTLERKGVSRGLATTIVFAAVGLILILVCLWLFPYLGQTLDHLHGELRFATRKCQRFKVLIQGLFEARMMKVHFPKLVVLNAKFFVYIRVFRG